MGFFFTLRSDKLTSGEPDIRSSKWSVVNRARMAGSGIIVDNPAKILVTLLLQRISFWRNCLTNLTNWSRFPNLLQQNHIYKTCSIAQIFYGHNYFFGERLSYVKCIDDPSWHNGTADMSPIEGYWNFGQAFSERKLSKAILVVSYEVEIKFTWLASISIFDYHTIIS